MKNYGRTVSMCEVACNFLLYEECKGKCVKHRILWGICEEDKLW